MVGYHCQVDVGSALQEIFSFNVTELTLLVLKGWLSDMAQCLPGAFI